MSREASGVALVVASVSLFPFARDSFELPHALLLVLGAALTSGALLGRDARRVLGLLAVVAVVTTASSTSPTLSAPGLVLACAVLAFGAAAGAVRWSALVVAAMPVAAWAMLQALGRDPFAWADVASWCGGMRPFATLGHPTQLGVWMGALTVLALDLARTRSRWFLACAVVTAGVCVSTLSRAGWLTLGVGVLTYGGLSLRARATSGRQLGLVAGALGVGGVVAVLAVGVAPLLERVSNALVAPTRVALWQTALAGFSAHPLLGWGFDTFTLVDQQLRRPDAWRFEWGMTASHAHAFPAQVLATQGLFGAVVTLVVVGLVVCAWWKRDAARATPAEVAVVVALSAASMVAFHGVLTSALLVTAVVKSLASAGDAARPRAWRWVTAPLLGLLGVMLAASGLARHGDVEGLSLAARLEPWSSTWPALLGAAHEGEGRLDEAAAAYDEAVRRVPTLAVSRANVGRVAARRGDGARAGKAFESARRLAPLDARIALDAAEAALQLGQLELAAGTLELTLRTYPFDGPAWFALGRVRLAQQRRVEARAMLEASLVSDWRDWPEGLGVARGVLTRLFLDVGDLSRARDVAGGATVAELPADICGAPQTLLPGVRRAAAAP